MRTGEAGRSPRKLAVREYGASAPVLGRRRRSATRRKYALIGIAIVAGMIMLGVATDLLAYLPRSPTVVVVRRAVSRLWSWVFTDNGLVTALVVVFIMVVFAMARRRLMKFLKDAD